MSDSQTQPVPIGNWTQYLKNALVGNSKFMQFIIGKSGGGLDDPAEKDCDKSFNASYQCGTGKTKLINIPSGARGQTAVFDCKDEEAKCLGFKLTLGDDGNLTMTNSKGATVWNSNTNKTGFPLDKYKAVNGKFKRNYLKSGEILNLGEFIGSPSGNCYLQMVKKQDGNAGLELRYETTACSSTTSNEGMCPASHPNAYAGDNIPGGYCCNTTPNSTGIYGPNVVDHCNGNFVKCDKPPCQNYTKPSNMPKSSGLYSVPKTNLDNLGKVAYITENGTLREYPDSMIGYGNNYYSMGKYKNEGNTIKTINNSTVDDCKKACNSDNSCAGIVFNNSEKSCELKSSQMFPKSNRVPDENSELYIRGKSISSNASCTKNINQSNAMEWELYSPGVKMSPKTLCSLGYVTQNERKTLEESNKELTEMANILEGKLKNLTKEDEQLVSDLGYNIEKLKKDINNYENVASKVTNADKQLTHTTAVGQDTNLNMISENYQYLLWTILAIIIIIGSIKVTR